MPLNKETLTSGILSALQAGQGSGGSAKDTATGIADAIDAYVRGIQIISEVTTTVTTTGGAGGGTGTAKSTTVN